MTQAEKREQKQEQLLTAYADMLRVPSGILVLNDILQQTKVGKDTFTPEATMNAYLQGKQSIGIFLNDRLAKTKGK